MLYPITVPRPNTPDCLVGFVHADGEMVVPPTYLGGSPFFEGRAAVIGAGGKSGFIDSRGALVVPCCFRGLGRYQNGLCSINGGFIDHSGKWFIKPRFLLAGNFSEGRALASQDGISVGYIDLAGQFVIPPEYQQCRRFSHGLAAVLRDGRWGYVDPFGNLRIAHRFEGPQAYPFDSMGAVVQADGRWGVIDPRGEPVLRAEYEEMRPFSEGFAAVRCDGTWTLMTRRGVIADWQLDELGDVSEGMAPARKDGRCGFISVRGGWAIEPVYDRCDPFHGELAVVCKGNAWSYLRRDGVAVWTSEDFARVPSPPAPQ